MSEIYRQASCQQNAEAEQIETADLLKILWLDTSVKMKVTLKFVNQVKVKVSEQKVTRVKVSSR